MPTALNSGRQALPPGAPTLPVPNSSTSLSPPLGAGGPLETEGLPHFYGLDYFHARLKALGLTKDNAMEYGLDVDEQGNILQLVRRFDGSFIEFIPQQFRKKVDRILSHRSTYQPHLEMYYRLLSVVRYHPDYLKANPKRSKYGNQFGEKVRPLPAPLAVKAYNDHATGGLITFIEGYFKALALDLAGVESVAFTGITVYRIFVSAGHQPCLGQFWQHGNIADALHKISPTLLANSPPPYSPSSLPSIIPAKSSS